MMGRKSEWVIWVLDAVGGMLLIVAIAMATGLLALVFGPNGIAEIVKP